MTSAYVGIGPGPTQAEWAAQAAAAAATAAIVDARTASLLAALARLRTIENQARTNAGLRGAAAWTQPQRVAVLDAIGDLAQGVRWLVQQQVAPRDPAD